jgi:uncharacterized protein (AIM24 family)
MLRSIGLTFEKSLTTIVMTRKTKLNLKSLAAFSIQAKSSNLLLRRMPIQFALHTKRKPASSSPHCYSSLPAKTSSDGVVGTPISFDTASQIEGNESQIVTIRLEPGQVLRAESGAMLYLTDGVTMETTTGGGLSAGFQRLLTGQNIFISDYRYDGPPGTYGQVALGTDFPSKILRLSVDEYGGKLVCQKGALLCASHTIDVTMEFAKNMTTGFFGGEGFVLQALTGEGDVFIKAGGALIRRDLDDAEQLRISSGCLVAFSPTVQYGTSSLFKSCIRIGCTHPLIYITTFNEKILTDVQMMPGIKNVLFGGEGLFVTTLTGPGTVWLQGQPPQRMIAEIARRVPSGGGLAVPIPIGGIGSSSGDSTNTTGEST